MGRFKGPEAVTVPEVFEARTILVLLPPLFLIVAEEGSIESVQPPGPVPVTGGPAAPDTEVSQSRVLICVLLPDTTVTGAMPAVVLTVA
jgi:hypothetical protein